MNTRALTLQGTLGLSVAMGIGRFFYTPMLPIMMVALNWSDSVSAWVATSNYLGYLAGSVVLSKNWLRPTEKSYRANLMFSTLLLALMAATDSPILQVVIRFLAGVSSVVIFVCITQFVAHNLKKPNLVGIVYGGVGLGITVSGATVWLFGQSLQWGMLWLTAAFISAAFSVFAWRWPVTEQDPSSLTGGSESSSNQRSVESKRLAFRLLDSGYFFQGFGYIIIGTYLVALAEPVFGDTAAALTWVLAGIAAIPSPYFWSFMAERFGRRIALMTCYGLQVIGAIAAIFGSSTIFLIVAAVLFGTTFMGVTMLTISTGIAHDIPGGSARLTTWYSMGQVAGPAIIGLAFADSIVSAFIVAGVAILIGMISTQLSRL